jgi:hypothetical protein
MNEAGKTDTWVAMRFLLLGDGTVRSRNRVGLLTACALAVVTGFVALALYIVNAHGIEGVSIAGTALMDALACLMIGLLIGFLFGIPRTMQGDRARLPSSTPTMPSSGTPASAEAVGQSQAQLEDETTYQDNTNLEQISDWLTKILVGVGLTQLTKIGALSRWIQDNVAPAIGVGGTATGRAFALGLVGYYIILGFLSGYLWTRMFMAGALREVQASLEMRVRAAESTSQDAKRTSEELRQQVQDQATRDAKAIVVVNDQLRPSSGGTKLSEDQLKEAIAGASAPVRMHLFNLAADQRRANWEQTGNPTALALVGSTAAVFQALIATGPEQGYHQVHAQLGYALKDKQPPDYTASEQALTKAIELRGAEPGWSIYELNRAICRIKQDANYITNQPSAADRRDAILADVRAVVGRRGVDYVNDVSVIMKWAQVNGVDLKALK